MRFALTDEQVEFGRSLTDLLARSDATKVARSWAGGDTGPGLHLWQRLAEQGVTALVVPEEQDGLGGTPVDLVVAFEALGHGLAVGPWIETAAYLATALGRPLPHDAVASVAVPPHTPYALDADAATWLFVATDDALRIGTAGVLHRSVDATRRLFEVQPDEVHDSGDRVAAAFDLAALACAAELLGCGERLLADTVAYAGQRRQFGREIGSYQAIKHRLADVRIALDLARPLVLGAAVTHGSATGSRDASAAKVATADAAYLASRVALQVHGAIGYTAELDLGLWINRVRALVGAWGTPAHHRGRVLDALTAAGA
jgi:alkylation response protein AidB-like acyl-CoA dehydrogenase